ncbi:DinB family protein [Priestia megaterium]|uniref:DinB family protein n=1 Tax=Priestia megaterium TaxID=1404 RepID=UPI002B241633|nr:DinB family protein [Priestia megaterium]MEB2294530.1 DinB family protein [Priestia megaterium]
MNLYIKAALHQLDVTVRSTITIINQLEEKDLGVRPIKDKRSIGEILEHMTLIPQADYLILNGASEEEMKDFYSQFTIQTLPEIKQNLLKAFEFLKVHVTEYREEQIFEKTTSYWGTEYTRYEWILEIVAHMYHHRGQLYTMLNYCGKNLEVKLFE